MGSPPIQFSAAFKVVLIYTRRADSPTIAPPHLKQWLLTPPAAKPHVARRFSDKAHTTLVCCFSSFRIPMVLSDTTGMYRSSSATQHVPPNLLGLMLSSSKLEHTLAHIIGPCISDLSEFQRIAPSHVHSVVATRAWPRSSLVFT